MRKIKLSFLIILAGLYGCSSCQKHHQKIDLPESLEKILHLKYPGAYIISEEDYCTDIKNMMGLGAPPNVKQSYSFISEDFNGDKILDYTFILKWKNQYLWLAALADQTKNSAYSLTEFGIPNTIENSQPAQSDKLCDGILIVGTDLVLGYGTSKLNIFPYISFENMAASTIYYWKDGQWIKTGMEP